MLWGGECPLYCSTPDNFMILNDQESHTESILNSSKSSLFLSLSSLAQHTQPYTTAYTQTASVCMSVGCLVQKSGKLHFNASTGALVTLHSTSFHLMYSSMLSPNTYFFHISNSVSIPFLCHIFSIVYYMYWFHTRSLSDTERTQTIFFFIFFLKLHLEAPS